MPTHENPASAERETPRPPSGLRRVLAWLQALEAAMDVSYDDIQDRRIVTLERDVAALRQALIDLSPGVLVLHSDKVGRGEVVRRD